MPFCRKCGAKLPEGASYCPNCGTTVLPTPPAAPIAKPRAGLAGWGERFIAWLIDIIIIGIFLSPIKFFFLLTRWPALVWAPRFLRWIPFVDFGLDNVIYFLYWTFMEGSVGQSIGKMVMKMEVTRPDGGPIDIAKAAVESLGKAFLLPIDCIIGWFLYPTTRQRLFNYISDTIVTKTTKY